MTRTMAIDRKPSVHRKQRLSKLKTEFKLLERIGSGGFGVVYKAVRKGDDMSCAIKIVPLDVDQNANEYKNEVKILSRVNHPNIIRYYDSWTESVNITLQEYIRIYESECEVDEKVALLLSHRASTSSRESQSDGSSGSSINSLEIVFNDSSNSDSSSFEKPKVVSNAKRNQTKEKSPSSSPNGNTSEVTVDFYIIQMELCAKSLKDAIENDEIYKNEAKVFKYFLQMCKGLHCLHQRGFIHRDIKPDNIFIDNNDSIRIGDFGLSKNISMILSIIDGNKEHKNNKMTYYIGTAFYMAPEMKTKNYKLGVDVYSLGITAYEMGCAPMTECQKAEIKGQFPFPENFGLMKIKKLISKMLHTNPEQRVTMNHVCNSLISQQELKRIFSQRTASPELTKKFIDYIQSSVTESTSVSTFLKTAVKVFEEHGAVNIPMPLFLPRTRNQYSTKMCLVCQGAEENSIFSLLQNSREVFAKYVATDETNHLRRYSTGKMILNDKQNAFPVEIQECCFDIVSKCNSQEELLKGNIIHVAEAIYSGYKIMDKVKLEDSYEVVIEIGHYLLTEALLIDLIKNKSKRQKFRNILKDLGDNATPESAFPFCNHLGIKKHVVDTLLNSNKLSLHMLNIMVAERKHSGTMLRKALQHWAVLKKLLINFNIPSDKVVLKPFLISKLNCQPINFQITYKSTTQDYSVALADGGNYEHLIKKYCKKSSNYQCCTAGISFNMDNIKLLLSEKKMISETPLHVGILISHAMFPIISSILKFLWKHGVICQHFGNEEECYDKNLILIKALSPPIAYGYCNKKKIVAYMEVNEADSFPELLHALQENRAM